MVKKLLWCLFFLKVKSKIPDGDAFSRVGKWKDEVACDVLAVDDSETC